MNPILTPGIDIVQPGSAYLLRDEFTTDRAAGAVNGTAAEPGPGTRVAADTNSKLTISSAALTFATGGAAAGDPGVWLNLVARAAGRVLVAEITPANVDGSAGVGWDTNTSGAINDALRLAATGALSLVANSGTAFTVGTYTAASLKVAAVMRGTGVFWFAYLSSKWVLLYRTEAGTANVYPAINAIGTTSIFTSSYLRVPLARWLPTPLVSDGFGSAFGTSDGLGHAEGVAGGIGAGGSGVTFSNAGATWSVSGGKAINTPTLGAELFDADAAVFTSGTYHWAAIGLNTIANVGNALQVTYVNNSGGAQLTLANSEDLSSDLTIGQWYTMTALVSVNLNSCSLLFGNYFASAVTISPTVITSTFYAVSTNTMIIRQADMGAGQIVTVDNLSLRPVSLSELLSVSSLACADVLAGVAITSTYKNRVGLALNWDSAASPANGVIVTLVGAYVNVYKCVAGVWSVVSSTDFTYSAGARLVVQKNGSEYRTYYNNALIKVDTIADAGILSNTFHGLFGTNGSHTFDDLAIYATGSSNEHSALDAF